MQQLPSLRAKYLIPAQFLNKNGIRLFNRKQFQDAVDNFQKAIEHCAGIESDENMAFILSVIEDNMALALDMLIYDSWIFDEVSSAEALDKLKAIESELISEELKQTVRNHIQLISREQAMSLQFDGNFAGATLKIQETLSFCSNDSQKIIFEKLNSDCSEMKELKLSDQELNDEFCSEILKLNNDVERTMNENLKTASAEWKFLMKLYAIKNLSNEDFKVKLMNSTVEMIERVNASGRQEDALEMIKLAKIRFPGYRSVIDELEDKITNKTSCARNIKSSSQVTSESQHVDQNFESRLVAFGLVSFIALIAVIFEIFCK